MRQEEMRTERGVKLDETRESREKKKKRQKERRCGCEERQLDKSVQDLTR